VICKIDWLSFLIRLDSNFEAATTEHIRYISTICKGAFPHEISEAIFSRPFSPVRGRAPYSVCVRREDNAISIFFGGKQSHILIEITGAGCEDLSRRAQLLPLVELVRPSLSRIDVAVDMPVPVTPSEFLSFGFSDRFKARSSMVTETGETQYVGSRDSERYARVYRYAPPHPRHEWLRCEFVLKHENAKAAAALLGDITVPELAARLGQSFEWKHPAWQPDKATDQKMPGWSPERRHGATVRWLLTSVFPAMARLVQEGTIEDLEAFLDQNLYTLLDD